ncbi:matrixin family metalloprotease [Silicimonas sp. MF1-12-2]|uniref:matrixin family metalloprotease n=1 Tax=Silicimonas sp. MF1-12-2 TaxID=3384793 RepID=UPI0039B62228
MSYDLIGFKWGASGAGTTGGVVTWSGDFFTSLDHASSYDDEDFEAALQDAFDRWESVASIDFQRVASGGNITIDVADYSGGIAGIASYSVIDRPGDFDSVSNTTLAFDVSDRLWSPGVGGAGESNFYAVALHEIGHLMGLAHPMPTDTDQIMNQTIFVSDLGNGDIQGAQFLYGEDPGDEVVPDTPSGDGGGSGIASEGGGGGGAAGLLLGLIAALLGMFLGGGAAAVAVVAGRLPGQGNDDEVPEEVSDVDHEGHDHGDYAYGELIQHEVYLPVVPIEAQASPCGCYSACDCLMEQAYEDAALI